MKVRMRFEKGRRAQSNEEDEEIDDDEFLETDQYTPKWVTFREDRILRARCPITMFLIHAFADKAIEGFASRNDIYNIRVPADSQSVAFSIASSCRNTPIFWAIDMNGQVSTTKTLKYYWVNKAYRALGARAHFKDALGRYNIRRGTANAMNGNHTSFHHFYYC